MLDGSIGSLDLEEEDRLAKPAAASAGEEGGMLSLLSDAELIFSCPSIRSNEGAIVFTDAKVRRCCIMS